jgi:hypothetical protein
MARARSPCLLRRLHRFATSTRRQLPTARGAFASGLHTLRAEAGECQPEERQDGNSSNPSPRTAARASHHRPGYLDRPARRGRRLGAPAEFGRLGDGPCRRRVLRRRGRAARRLARPAPRSPPGRATPAPHRDVHDVHVVPGPTRRFGARRRTSPTTAPRARARRGGRRSGGVVGSDIRAVATHTAFCAFRVSDTRASCADASHAGARSSDRVGTRTRPRLGRDHEAACRHTAHHGRTRQATATFAGRDDPVDLSHTLSHRLRRETA